MALAVRPFVLSAPGVLALLSACSGEPFGVLYGRQEAGPDVASPSLDDGGDAADGAPADAAAPLDAASEAPSVGVPEAAPAPDADAAADAPWHGDADAGDAEVVHATCAVTFVVTNAFVDGFMLKGVALGGDATALGTWNPGAATPLTAVSPGAWSGAIVLADGQQVEFRFVETGPNEDVWESFTPAGNRTLTVACPTATNTSPPQYTGQFDVRPPDAT